MKFLQALAAIAVLGSMSVAASGGNRVAPTLSLPDRDGATISLQSLKGKVVLVDIWASWCIPCRAAFPAYDSLYRQYRDQGFEVLAINVDETRSAADRFLSGREFQMRVLFDPTGVAPTGFNVRAMPTSYLVDKQGAIRFSHEGFTDKALPQYRREVEQLIQEAR